MEQPCIADMDLGDDVREELERAIEGLERAELDSVLEGAINDLLSQTATPPPPPCFPAEPPASPQPAADRPPAFVQHAAQMTAPPTTEPAQVYSQPGTVSQGQNLLYQWPVHTIPTSATAPPAAPAYPYNILQIPDSMLQYLHPVGMLNGVVVCDLASAAAPLNPPTPKKRKRQDEREGEYIKKPPNAFMVFLREQRPKVKAELKIGGSAAVNAVVGERWKLLSKDQQATYYEQAEQQRKLHAQKHPDWSSKDNYGKQKKRTRRSTCSTESQQHKLSPASPV